MEKPILSSMGMRSLPWLAGSLLVFACGDSNSTDPPSEDAGLNDSGIGNPLPDGGNNTGGDGATSNPDGGTVNPTIPVPVPSEFNKLPELANVQGEVRWHTAHVKFDAFGGAKDYRIYPLPSQGTMAFDAEGRMTVPNAIYRCAGLGGATTNSTVPFTKVSWPGITVPTTFVIEALDSGCPDLGHISPTTVSSDPSNLGWKTLPQMKSAQASGELFVNGQVKSGGKPKAIARSLISATPSDFGTWDWKLDFADSPQTFTEDCSGGCPFQSFYLHSSDLDIEMVNAESAYHSFGTLLGELRTTFVDWAFDTNGKLRITPKTARGAMSDTGYLHVTMETNALTTSRRYPQILISDQTFPIGAKMAAGRTMVIQTFGNGEPSGNPYDVQVQLCDHRTWDVNNQCPMFALSTYYQPGFNGWLEDNNKAVPRLEPAMAFDNRAKFDVYASTKKVYVFYDGKPFGCGVFPNAPVAPSGAVTVAFGNVLYHSGASDSQLPSVYGHTHMQLQTQAMFGNLGFASNVGAPPWDEAKIPCRQPAKFE